MDDIKCAADETMTFDQLYETPTYLNLHRYIVQNHVEDSKKDSELSELQLKNEKIKGSFS